MKSYIILFIIFFVCFSCKKESNNYIQPHSEAQACGVEDPLNNLMWLNELANTAMEDKSGNYIGKIWVFSLEGNDIIVTNMALGSGGIFYHFFDCKGEPISDLANLEPDDLKEYLTNSNKLFSNIN